jgi:hypothetical protein
MNCLPRGADDCRRRIRSRVKHMSDETGFAFDVFVSYSSADKAWVRGALLERIETAGLRTFIDFRDFKPGAPSIKEMESGITDCRKTIVVLTPAYIASEWCEMEGVMLQTLSPANRDCASYRC